MYKTTLRNAPFSAYKGRLVIEIIKGQNVENALKTLSFAKVKAAKVIKKVLESVIANAEFLNNAEIDELKVVEAFIDEGVSLKRIRSRAKGRANSIKKRTCNITIKIA